ncbi:tetratricopeptide repeat protein [Ekhidna sp.]|uniref:tetratricopeptide repeat protein n=1 Tax=Ekhidna sp. TaxID=2608089 RepID=UPI003BA90BC8
MLTLLFNLFSLFYGYDESAVDQLHQQSYDLLESNLDSALLITDRALNQANNIDYGWGIANSYYIKAYIYDEKNELDKAFLFYLKAEDQLKNKDEERFLKTRIDVILNIGSILRRNSKYDEAIQFYERGLDLISKDDFDKRRANLCFNIASVHQDVGDLNSALNYLTEAATISEKLDYNWLLLKVWNLQGLVFKDLEDYQRSRTFYKKIITLSTSKDIVSKAYHNMAITYKEEQDFIEADNCLKKALTIKKELGREESLFRTLKELAALKMVEKDWEEAKFYALEAEKLYENVSVRPETFEIYHLLEVIFFANSSYQKSHFYSNSFAEESTRFYNQQTELIALKDAFKSDLILAAFQQEQLSRQQKVFLFKWIYAILFLSMVIITTLYIRKSLMKKTIKEAVTVLERGTRY